MMFQEVTWIVKKQIHLWSAELLVSIAIPRLLFCTSVKLKKKSQPFAYFYFIFSFLNLSSRCLLNSSETILNQQNQMARVYVL